MHLKSIQRNTLCPMKSHEDETISVMENLRRLNVCARIRVMFSRNFFRLFFFISRSLKAIKRFGLSFAVVNIIKMIFVTRLRLHEGRCLPVLIWLCFWFSSICSGEISQNVHNLCNLSRRSFESQKNWGCRGSILTICNFAFSPLSQIWSYELFENRQ